MFRKVSLVFTAIAVFGMSAQIAAPELGYIVDNSGGLRRITGVAGAFAVGPSIEADVITVAFSGKTLVIKKATELLVNGDSFPAPSGPAEAQFASNGSLEQVFFPDVSLLWTWQNGRFDESNATRLDQSVNIVRNDEVVISGVPVRFPSRVHRASQLGENWLAVYAQSGIYVFRDGKIFELPEAEQE
jgi:hypothetical protein